MTNLKRGDFFDSLKKFNHSSYSVMPSASFLIVTRNRSPYADFNKNPLAWSITSLINGNSSLLNEIIVVDDNSSDYTLATIEKLRRQTSCPIRYYKNKKRKGCSYSRQVAINKASNDLVFMGDDDCLYSDDFVAGSIVSYLDIMAKDKKVAVLNLPVYERNYFPKEDEKMKNIGKWIIKKAHFSHNFDKFPIEYIKKPVFLKHRELSPFKIDIMYGVNLSSKNYIIEVGGYEDLSMWDNDYSEHMELSYRLKKGNYSIYHQPDPRFSAIHLKYGARSINMFDRRSSRRTFHGIKYNLGQLIKQSQVSRHDTGARINDYDFHVNQIGSFFSFYVKISRELGLKFAMKEYINFVINNQVYSTTPTSFFSLVDRKEIFKKAIVKGANVSCRQKKESFDDVLKLIFSNKRIR